MSTMDDFDQVFEEITSEGQPEEGREQTPEDIRKQAHGADSMRGRLEKEKARTEELRARAEHSQQPDAAASDAQGETATGTGREEDEAWAGQPEESPAPRGESQDLPAAPEPRPEKQAVDEPEKPGPASPEPEGRDDPAKEAKEPEKDVVSEEDRRKAAEYQLIKEQLQLQQKLNKQLEARLSQFERTPGPLPRQESGQAPRVADPGPAPEPAPKKAAIPEDLAEDAKEFNREYPDFFRYLEEDSPVGERMRKALRDYGPEQAALIAETRVLHDEIRKTREESRQREQQVLRTLQEEKTVKHFSSIEQAHPEMAWRNDPEKKEDFRQFALEINQWIETLPYREAVEAIRIRDKGSAPEGIELLNRFKEYKGLQESAQEQGAQEEEKQQQEQGQTSPSGEPAQDMATGDHDSSARKKKEERENMIRAAEAVASRPPPPQPPRPGRDDFDGAWEEAVGANR